MDFPQDEAQKLLSRAHGKVRRVDSSPEPPIQAGWLVVYRDRNGNLCGGCDDRTHGTVKVCRWIEQGWVVMLTDGQQLPLTAIRSVGSINAEGKLYAAWTVREHGYDGHGVRGGGHE